MSDLSLRALFGMLALLLFAGSTAAQTPPIAGEYEGKLGPLRLKLHIQAAPGNQWAGTLDSLDQNALGIPCTDFKVDGSNLSFEVPAVKGRWSGTVSADGQKLTGSWNQGSAMPLEWERVKSFTPAAKPSAVDGIWLGTLKAGSQALRAQLHLRSDAGGREECSFDSLDQGALDLECTNVLFNGSDFSFDVPRVKGHWSGKLSADHNTLAGMWSQGTPMPLDFARQEKAAAPKPVAPPTFDSALRPLKLDDLKEVLDRDFAKAQVPGGGLEPGKGLGIAIGVLLNGERRVVVYGDAKPESVFEIGSISKTFTGLILAQMIEQGKVKATDPVRMLLPAGTVAQPPSGAEITLLDLVTQHSGLPRMPDNFHPADGANPYADYRASNLYEFISKHGVAKAGTPEFLYSNLGFGLLGQALANRAGTDYPALLAAEVTGPLHLPDTAVRLSPEQQARFLSPHDGEHQPAHAWDLDAMAGAGAIRSTAGDMLTYLAAQLHPEDVDGSGRGGMSDALKLTHELRADAPGEMKIGFAWLYKTATGTYWHNGATGGYSSYAFFNPKANYAAVVLYNASIGSAGGSFADRAGEHIEERLSGKAAISLAP
jgi:serine-type D-Ala-D-Ala carboxypeptidase/endopeptidase